MQTHMDSERHIVETAASALDQVGTGFHTAVGTAVVDYTGFDTLKVALVVAVGLGTGRIPS